MYLTYLLQVGSYVVPPRVSSPYACSCGEQSTYIESVCSPDYFTNIRRLTGNVYLGSSACPYL